MQLREFLDAWQAPVPTMVLHTSGSTGAPKAIRVEKERMRASARMTCRFLGLGKGDRALLCLPLDYIAGQMMVVRALTCGLQLLTVAPSSRPLQELVRREAAGALPDPIHFAAMVALQVEQSLAHPREARLLRSIRHLIIGGGAVPPQLEQKLRDFPHAVWSTYGMTETLSHIALRRLNGDGASPWYEPLPGVRVGLNARGCLRIEAGHVCRRPLDTNDLALLHEDGRRFRILGRMDNVVCSGGLKLQLEELEQTLRPHLPTPFLFTKVPHPQLGEAVVLLSAAGDVPSLVTLCRRALPRHSVPRWVWVVPRLPLTASGKPAR
ncbi:MAG: AMP-binding protein, partial [Desulfovibrio sp.]|nr:AMP-binding protein [Desulfovibrio sp.]